MEVIRIYQDIFGNLGIWGVVLSVGAVIFGLWAGSRWNRFKKEVKYYADSAVESKREVVLKTPSFRKILIYCLNYSCKTVKLQRIKFLKNLKV